MISTEPDEWLEEERPNIIEYANGKCIPLAGRKEESYVYIGAGSYKAPFGEECRPPLA
jgi:hypothetical protein